MEELYSIMSDLLDLEHNQKSLLWLLEAIEAAYSGDEQKEINFTVNSAKYYLKALQAELRAVISRIDNYIVAVKDK